MRKATRRPPGAGARGTRRAGSDSSRLRAHDARSLRTPSVTGNGTGEGQGAARAHHRRRRTSRRANEGTHGLRYAAAVDLSYPPEAEAFRVEIRAWLEENLPAG